VVLAFAFMISSASSKYFDGLLFILVRRPFQIGDAIHISNVESDTSTTGSAWWTVEDVNLFETKAVYLFTMERCSLSNGSLANSRIINSSQSSEPYLWFALRFPVDVKLDQLNTFTAAVEQFVKNRPREWLSYADFRAMRVDHYQGFVEYLVGAQHRATWADWATIMLSKSDLVLFCNELQKRMNIHYKSPPLPIDLTPTSVQAFRGLPTIAEHPLEQNHPVIAPPLPDMADITELEALIPPRGSSRL
jgi:small-conductance mechanosensitive channel